MNKKDGEETKERANGEEKGEKKKKKERWSLFWTLLPSKKLENELALSDIRFLNFSFKKYLLENIAYIVFFFKVFIFLT